MSPTRRHASLGHLSSGLGMFGCIDTHVHRKMVRMQLRIMSPSDLHPFGSSQERPVARRWSRERTGRGGDDRPTGNARVAARMVRMNIMVVRR